MFTGNLGKKDKKRRCSLKGMTGQGKDFFLLSRAMSHRSMTNAEQQVDRDFQKEREQKIVLKQAMGIQNVFIQQVKT